MQVPDFQFALLAHSVTQVSLLQHSPFQHSTHTRQYLCSQPVCVKKLSFVCLFALILEKVELSKSPGGFDSQKSVGDASDTEVRLFL